ncbi:Imm42 family immunity protein [Caballeronia cordobensis]|uniref:Imm42 family immunity protein n=1 Tax=Caballeronia cordobensis TaxID=1353886 RepID=UPI00045EF08C|nr:putative membrane protein [Burkholderia sp. RPE67]
MLSGDPGAFAIWCDPVESWSKERFKNGCFGYFLENEFFYSSVSTLGVDLNLLNVVDSMKGSVEDERLFSAAVVDVYRELCERAFPSIDSDAEKSDFKHLVSVGSLLDDGHNVFLVEWEDQARIIYGRNEDVESVMDVVLDREKFQSVVREATKKYKDLPHS